MQAVDAVFKRCGEQADDAVQKVHGASQKTDVHLAALLRRRDVRGAVQGLHQQAEAGMQHRILPRSTAIRHLMKAAVAYQQHDAGFHAGAAKSLLATS